uniref:Integrase catalytic domain-containing protein n=1 Tax=Fagus sylvatica TaxID=28930 RepID=A0A2N9HML0_FAGSY
MEGEKMAYKMMNQDFVKLDKFDGSNFIHTEQLKQQRIKKEEDELVCRGHILNTLSDRLYDLFTTMTSPKEIWKALETKYKTEKQGTDKFIIQKYFDFKMMDNVSVLDQVHELQIMVHKLNDLSIKIPELFQVGAIIAKLPPSWNNYRKKLLHMAEELTLEQIGTHLRIEQESRIRESTNYVSKVNEGTINYVLNGGVGSSKTNKSFRPNKKIVKKTNSNKDKKGRACFHCGKKGHYIRECRFLKNQMKEKELNTSEANVVDEIVAMVSEMQIGMITEVHMANAAENSSEWWYDSGATIHVCNNKMLFKEYVEAGNGLEVLMGNHNIAKVLGTRTVEMILSNEKKLKLTNVYHVPNIKKNLVSASLLSKNGVKAVLESDKLILSKFGVFVGKGYSCNGMYKLNLIINKNDVGYAYIVNSSLLWHARLGHLNFKYMKYMSKHGLISYKQDVHDKCEICIESKIRKKPFPSTNRDSQLLELVHSDVCELNGILTRGGKRYFITFIDDFSRYTYVYLMRNKDESFDMFKKYKTEVENQKDKRIKILISDRGGEYFPQEFTIYCEENGLIHQRSAPYTPQQNGLAERKNRTPVDMLNAMRVSAKLPFNLWGEALLTACHVHNRVLSYFRVPNPKRTKLGPRAIKSVFVGYTVNSKAYRLLDLSSNTIVESRDWKQENRSQVHQMNKGGVKGKYKTDGTIQTFKARLVAKGFRQREGIDYFDTYAPVARITSIRVLIALASIYKLVVHQMDVKTAFLNGDLDEEVYMDQPEGFVLPGNEKKVYKLVKSLYGLKQAPKQWHEKFDTVILANGFKHNGADKCVYSKFTSEYGVIVCLYVDDMLIFGNKYARCIKVKRHSEGYALCQNHYIEKLVENTGRVIAQLEFASAIGSMMYAMHCTRPDIAFAVNRLSRYTSNPSAEHWKAIARVLGYLKKTKDLGLYYSGYPAVLEGYSDANWVTSVGDNKSTSGWIFTLGGGAISWASKKQSCISHSTMESEFIALASAGKEAEWLRNMLYDIELWPQPMSAIFIYCDSQATISKAYSKIYNGKSRHISLRHEYVRQLVEDGVISIVYVKSSGNLADPFTKGLSRDMTGFEDLGSLEFLPNPVYWTTNPVDWMTCIWLIQSPGLVVQSTGCRAWEFLPNSVAWTTNSGDWITAVRGS